MLDNEKLDETKETVGVYGMTPKERIMERVFMLAERYPTRNAAARAWKMNENTLKNYYRRKKNQSTPRESLLRQIAEAEGVSFKWLVTGEGEPTENTKKTPKTPGEPTGSQSFLDVNDDQLLNMLSFLTTQERQQLTEVLARKGVEMILCLLNDINLQLMRLDTADKIRALEIITGKKGSSETSEHVAQPDLLSGSKKAG
ncbi:hypothetical protein [Kluyvera georgiana]|uniref:hypothetical protein n=1 Tax=Kluyvera georgiana TaxID=73098 RepID=UPI003F671AD8